MWLVPQPLHNMNRRIVWCHSSCVDSTVTVSLRPSAAGRRAEQATSSACVPLPHSPAFRRRGVWKYKAQVRVGLRPRSHACPSPSISRSESVECSAGCQSSPTCNFNSRHTFEQVQLGSRHEWLCSWETLSGVS